MKVKCCICQTKIGEQSPPIRVKASFSWRNQGLCPECYGRARAAITRAYGAPLTLGTLGGMTEKSAG